MRVFDKTDSLTLPNDLRKVDLYPYFQRIEESRDTEVMIDGHRKIMIGSNNYMGLTHDPRIIEAAKAALDKYGCLAHFVARVGARRDKTHAGNDENHGTDGGNDGRRAGRTPRHGL